MNRIAIERFVDEVWESLPRLRQALAAAYQLPFDRQGLDKAHGLTQAIATGAATLKLDGLAEVASANNWLLTQVQHGSLSMSRALYESLDQLTELLETATSAALKNPEATPELLNQLRQLIAPHQASSASSEDSGLKSAAETGRDDNVTASPPAPPSELDLLRAAANEQIREMARRLDLFRRDLNRWDVLADVRRRLHSLRMAGRSAGLPDFAGLAQHAEDLLQRLLDRSIPANERAADCLLATIDALDVRLQSGLDVDILLQVHDQLDEVAGERSRYSSELNETFTAPPEVITPPPVAPVNPPVAPVSQVVVAEQPSEPPAEPSAEPIEVKFDDRAELDGEMGEVFNEEAEEHLGCIDTALSSLDRNPSRIHSVREIRRSAHTLKGAAGAVKLRLVSKLAHRMEDLLDQVVEAPPPVSPATISLLHGTTDALHDLVTGNFDPYEMRTTVSNLFARYDVELRNFGIDVSGDDEARLTTESSDAETVPEASGAEISVDEMGESWIVIKNGESPTLPPMDTLAETEQTEIQEAPVSASPEVVTLVANTVATADQSTSAVTVSTDEVNNLTAIEADKIATEEEPEPVILTMPMLSSFELIPELPTLELPTLPDVDVTPKPVSEEVAPQTFGTIVEPLEAITSVVTTTPDLKLVEVPESTEVAASAPAPVEADLSVNSVQPESVAQAEVAAEPALAIEPAIDGRGRPSSTADAEAVVVIETPSLSPVVPTPIAPVAVEVVEPEPPAKPNEIVVRDALPMLTAWNQRPLAETIIDETTAERADAGERRHGESLRVPLERVDSLVREIGELLINRTSFEQRMQDFLQYVDDLQRAVERLRQASRDLDTKYGVGLLGGRQRLFDGDTEGSRGGKRFSAKAREEFDALEMDRYTEFHLLSRTLSEATADIGTIGIELRSLHGDFDQLLHRQGRLGRNTQDRLMRIRMIPLMQLASRLQRTVRSVAEPQHKLVDFVIAGGETEVDKRVLEDLADPLMHLLRNAVDHGIESPEVRRAANKPERATIRLQAFAQGTQIVLKVSDDGVGLNLEAIRQTARRLGLIPAADADRLTDEQLAAMIFLPGLSTAAKLSEVSGRGIGMDIVADKVRRRHGTIGVETRAGHGTTFTIRLPITLSVTRALLVMSGEATFALPLQSIAQILRVERQSVERLGHAPVLRLGGEALPLVFLNERLSLKPAATRVDQMLPVVVLASGDDKIALAVDKILASRDIVVKPLGTHLRNVPGLLGATLLGDGSVVPILDPAPLVVTTSVERPVIEAASAPTQRVVEAIEPPNLDTASDEQPEPVLSVAGHDEPLVPPQPEVEVVAEPPLIMVVDDSVSVRRVTSNLLKKAGLVPLEAKDGLDALDKLRSTHRPPDLFLLDIEMPRMDGFDLLNSLRMTPAHRETPVVMITSRAAEKHRTKARQLGASEYLVKPFQDEQLLTLIGSLLTQREVASST